MDSSPQPTGDLVVPLPAPGAAPGRTRRRWSWLPIPALILGALLRIVAGYGTDVRHVYDDHFHVIKIILEEKRWPKPAEDWETYQPPLYHAVGALTYYLVTRRDRIPAPPPPAPGDNLSPEGPRCPYPWHVAGRKAVQFISVVAGILTLAVIWLTLRHVFPASPGAQAAGMTFAALLPRHVYMSAMATNDALTYLWTCLCLYAVLRALPGRWGWWVAAGVAAALAMWTKQYGLGCLAVVLAPSLPAIFRWRAPVPRRQIVGSGVAFVMAVGLGCWPYVRTWWLTGNALAGNYTLVPNDMGDQLPGAVSEISWTSLRLPQLLARPFIHLNAVDSFWSQIYGELWFDYGTAVTAVHYRPWVWQLLVPIWRDTVSSGPDKERRELDWPLSVAPERMVLQGRLLLVLGLLPSVVMLLGLLAIWRQTDVSAAAVVTASFLTGLATPIFQTLRQPFRSSMKATFVLHALAAMTVLFAAGYLWLRANRNLFWLRWLVVLNLLALAGAAAWHFWDIAIRFPQSLDYFAARNPL